MSDQLEGSVVAAGPPILPPSVVEVAYDKPKYSSKYNFLGLADRRRTLAYDSSSALAVGDFVFLQRLPAPYWPSAGPGRDPNPTLSRSEPPREQFLRVPYEVTTVVRTNWEARLRMQSGAPPIPPIARLRASDPAPPGGAFAASWYVRKREAILSRARATGPSQAKRMAAAAVGVAEFAAAAAAAAGSARDGATVGLADEAAAIAGGVPAVPIAPIPALD